MGTKNGKWDGKGDPPSLKAAIAWLKSHGLTTQQATSLVPTGPGSLRRVGQAARKAVSGANKEHKGLGEGLLRGISQVPDELDRLLPGSMPSPGGGSRKAPKKGSNKKPAASITDANGDGSLADDMLAAATEGGDENIAALLAAGPGGAVVDSRGAPLWPYKGGEETLGAITVENRSKGPAKSSHWGSNLTKQGSFGRPDRVGARYFEADTVSPLRWSAEDRANLQRVMHGLGMYGDKKVRLGSWTATDQAAFAEVLAHSNTSGTRWHETLAGWKQTGLPPELQEELTSGQPARPTIQVTNPVDIRSAAKTVSQEMTGAVDRGFVEGAVAPYQGLETAAQSGVYGDQEGGGGGTVTQAPSMGGYMEDKLRREKPLEVDGYQFLGQFEQFLSMLGAQ